MESRIDAIADILTGALARGQKEEERKKAVRQARFWSNFGWASIDEPENRNTDQIPRTFNVDFPCPRCGSVWVELEAYGFLAPKVSGQVAAWCEDGPLLSYVAPNGLAPARALRLRCADGHSVEWDADTGEKRVLLDWRYTAMLGMGAIVAAYALPILASTRKL